MFRLHRRLQKPILAAVGVAVILLGAWFAMPREPDLITAATRMSGSQGWDAELSLPGSDLLVFREIDSFLHRYTISRVDPQNGVESALTELTRQFTATSGYSHSAAVSPDGKWLLWPATDRYVASTVDGTRRLEWPKPHAEMLRRNHTGNNTWRGECWLGDSKHWVELDDSDFTFLKIHSVNKPAESRVVTVPPGCNAYRGGSLAGCVPGSANDRLAFVTMPGGGGQEQIMELDLNGASAIRARQTTVQLPQHESVPEVAIEPGCRRILWKLTRVENAWFPRPLFRFFPSLGATRRRVSLWTSDGSGGNMCEQASTVEAPPRQVRGRRIIRADYVPSGFRWLPGGKAAMFIYQQSAYTLPIR